MVADRVGWERPCLLNVVAAAVTEDCDRLLYRGDAMVSLSVSARRPWQWVTADCDTATMRHFWVRTDPTISASSEYSDKSIKLPLFMISITYFYSIFVVKMLHFLSYLKICIYGHIGVRSLSVQTHNLEVKPLIVTQCGGSQNDDFFKYLDRHVRVGLVNKLISKLFYLL